MLICFCNAVIQVFACEDAVILPELERRSTFYTTNNTNKSLINDNHLTEGWYSVVKDGRQYLMPDTTNLPGNFACGGFEPMYLKGLHPKVATLTYTPVTVDVCVRTLVDDCDTQQYAIKLRKCGDAIQYYLVPAKSFAAYCFDPVGPQRNGRNKRFATTPVTPYSISIEDSSAMHSVSKSSTAAPTSTLDINSHLSTVLNPFYSSSDLSDPPNSTDNDPQLASSYSSTVNIYLSSSPVESMLFSSTLENSHSLSTVVIPTSSLNESLIFLSTSASISIVSTAENTLPSSTDANMSPSSTADKSLLVSTFIDLSPSSAESLSFASTSVSMLTDSTIENAFSSSPPSLTHSPNVVLSSSSMFLSTSTLESISLSIMNNLSESAATVNTVLSSTVIFPTSSSIVDITLSSSSIITTSSFTLSPQISSINPYTSAIDYTTPSSIISSSLASNLTSVPHTTSVGNTSPSSSVSHLFSTAITSTQPFSTDNTTPSSTTVTPVTVTVLPVLRFDQEVKRQLVNNIWTNTIDYIPYVVFTCTFEKNSGQVYGVNWLLNDSLFKALGPSQQLEDLTLSEKTFLDENVPLGFTLKCVVYSFGSNIGTSPSYFAGIVVLNPVINLDKADIGTVRFKLTVPLGCRYNSHVETAACKMGLAMDNQERYTCDKAFIAQLKDGHECGQDIEGLKKNSDWNPEREYFYNITTTDENYNDRINFVLRLRTEQQFGHRWWNNYSLDSVQINVNHDRTYQYKRCYSHVDPHMKTADGFYYENQEIGEYLLYRNTKYDIEVLEKYDRCNRNYALCTCGVIIRAGADVFAINLCNKVRFAEFLSCADGGILKIVERHSMHYRVFTPIGTWIDIYIHGYGTYDGFMNIDIMMAPKDLGRTEGLCGYMDGRIGNDLIGRDGIQNALVSYPLQFTRSWRLTNEENLFKHYKKVFKKWHESNALYCICEHNVEGKPKKSFCSPSQYLDCHLKPESTTSKKCKKVKDRKRSVAHKAREIERLMALANLESDRLIRETREDSEPNITESEALEGCILAINTSVVVTKLSDAIPGEDPSNVTEQCVFDVLTGNDMKLGNVHVDALNSAAQMTIQLDPDFTDANAERIKYFVKNSCPGNCSERGECLDSGECKCERYFHGPDCGIDERNPVVITDMEGGGLCNLTDGDGCDCFYLRTNFLLPNFTCDISGQVIFIDGTIENITSSINTGDYEDIFTGICCVPQDRTKRSLYNNTIFSKTYNIALSNDGRNFGNPESIYVYDSQCQEAVQDSYNAYHITLKENYCFIDGLCVEQSDVNFDDNCLICDSRTNTFAWTQDCRPRDPNNSKVGLILGASLGAIATFSVVILLFAIWHSKVKPKYRKKRFWLCGKDVSAGCGCNTFAYLADLRSLNFGQQDTHRSLNCSPLLNNKVRV